MLKNEKKYLVYIVLAVTFIVYLPSLVNGFTTWDDDDYIEKNEDIKSISWENTKSYFTKSYVAHYQPLVMLSYAVEYNLFKLNPFPYHALNLLLHLINCALVFWFIFLLFNNLHTAFLVSLLFGIHPIHVESVAWIAERKDVLYALFFLLSLIYYIKSSRENKVKYYYYALVFFLFSLLSKAMAVTLPAILIIIDYFILKKINKKIIINKVPFFLLSILFSIIIVYVTYNASAHEDVGELHKLSSHYFKNFLAANYGILFYIKKLILPIRLSAYYPYPNNFYESTGLIFYLSLFIISAVLSIVFYTRKAIFGFLFFFITLLPVLKIIPMGDAIAADRYTYIPSLGLFYIISSGFFWLYNKKKNNVLKLVGIACIVSLCVLSWQRSKIWANDETLWADVIKNYPDCQKAHYFLAQHYSEYGSLKKSIRHLDKAIKEYEILVQLDPDDSQALNNLGYTHKERAILTKDKSATQKAIYYYLKAIKVNPKHIKALVNLGNSYAVQGLLIQAIQKWEEALKIDPHNKGASENIKKAKIILLTKKPI